MAADDISASTWSETAASNTTAGATGWAANSAPSTAYTVVRDKMAAIKRWFNRTSPTITSAGTNTITLTYTTAPNAYVQGDTYSFIAGGNNSGATTLNVNGLGAKAITKNGTTALAGGEILTGAVITVKYDGTQFQLTDGVLSTSFVGGVLTALTSMSGKAFNEAKGAAVASATSCDIWTPADGNLVHITGVTTITSFATAPQAGACRKVIFDGAVTITNNANIVVPGGANYTTAANDVFDVFADTTTKVYLIPALNSGKAVIASATSPFANFSLLTAGTTFNVPAGVSTVLVTIQGGGGGGGAANLPGAGSTAAPGGGCGAAVLALVAVTPGGTVTYSIGGAGTAGNGAGSTAGGAGGDTVFGTVTAKGGVGGAVAITSGVYPAAPNSAPVSPLLPAAGTVVLSTFVGTSQANGSGTTGAAGGNSLFGTGGTGGNNNVGNAPAATNYGAGGGGGGQSGSGSKNGGAGLAGAIAVLY